MVVFVMYIKGNIKSKLGFALLIFVLAISPIYFYGNYQIGRLLMSSENIESKKSILLYNSASTASSKIDGIKASSQHVNVGNATYGTNDASITSDWMTKVGKLTHEERADYAYYDEKTLIDLANNGDTKAMDVLTNLYMQRSTYEDRVKA